MAAFQTLCLREPFSFSAFMPFWCSSAYSSYLAAARLSPLSSSWFRWYTQSAHFWLWSKSRAPNSFLNLAIIIGNLTLNISSFFTFFVYFRFGGASGSGGGFSRLTTFFIRSDDLRQPQLPLFQGIQSLFSPASNGLSDTAWPFSSKPSSFRPTLLWNCRPAHTTPSTVLEAYPSIDE